jgi:hypothetical protein
METRRVSEGRLSDALDLLRNPVALHANLAEDVAGE